MNYYKCLETLEIEDPVGWGQEGNLEEDLIDNSCA